MNCEMVCVGVRFGVDAERDDAHLARRARDAHRDLAAVGDQEALDQARTLANAAAPLEERAQALLPLRAHALLRDRLRRDRARFVVRYGRARAGSAASPRRSRTAPRCAARRRAARRPRRARPAGTISCTRPICFGMPRVEAFAGEEERARVRRADLCRARRARSPPE